MAEIEHHEIQCRGERRIIELRKFRHLEVVVFGLHVDAAEHAIEHGDRQLPASLRNGCIAGGIGGERWRQRRLTQALGAVAHRAVRLKDRPALGIARLERICGEAERGSRERGARERRDNRRRCGRTPPAKPAHFSAGPNITDTEQ